jgi:sugar phosphate permease
MAQPAAGNGAHPDPMSSKPVPFVHVYFAFAAGYFLSYLLRTVNAVISPELTRELGLTSSSLGLLTSAYFIAFGAMQIPAGMLLDRYGPRRIEPVLLVLCGVGTLAFAFADGVSGLLVARALIGAGVSVCLMAPLKAISAWYPAERQASLAAWIMVAGGAGALAATTPVEIALRFTDWRGVFMALSVFALGVAAWIWWRVPDATPPATSGGIAAQWAGVKTVFASPRFWWIAPLGSLGMGSFMAIQGLWSVPWLMDVTGHDRAEAARHLLVMSAVTLAGYLILGLFATRLASRSIHPRHLYAAGFALNFVALAAIVLRLPGTYFWWSAYGFGAAVNILAYPLLCEGFPKALAGRANTTLNLLLFVGSFAAQWGIGVVVDLVRGAGGGNAVGLERAFLIVLVANLLAYAWFALGWRRHALHEPAVPRA